MVYHRRSTGKGKSSAQGERLWVWAEREQAAASNKTARGEEGSSLLSNNCILHILLVLPT